jgi:hypothetical protein
VTTEPGTVHPLRPAAAPLAEPAEQAAARTNRSIGPNPAGG